MMEKNGYAMRVTTFISINASLTDESWGRRAHVSFQEVCTAASCACVLLIHFVDTRIRLLGSSFLIEMVWRTFLPTLLLRMIWN